MNNFRFESYRHEPLPSKSSIRLLVPTQNRVNPSEPMVCGQRLLQFKLETVDLEDSPHFDCLSYSNADPFWRLPSERSNDYDPTNKWPIAVNDRLAFVSKNLYEGLCQLHPLGEPYPGVDDRICSFNKTRLIYEAELGNHLEIERLIKLGANLRAVDMFGETALHYAAENGRLETVKVLLRSGADVNMIDSLGRTPIDCGLQSKYGQYAEVAQLMGERSVIEDLAKPELTHANTTTRLWVDCISINSNDVQERNSQVAMMNEIYRAASRVVVWLGKDDDDSRSEKVRSLTESVQSERFANAIGDLMNRSYFHRVWTVQELAVAKDIAIFCGPQEYVSLNPLILPYLAFRSEIKAKGNTPKAHGGGLRIWLDRHMEQHQQEMKSIISDLSVDLKHKASGKISWSALLAMTWNHESTDTRDKVYALYGLASPLPSESSFMVDYTRSKADIFLQVGRYFIAGDPNVIRRQAPFSLDHFLGGPNPHTRPVLRPGDIAGQGLAALDGLSYNQRSWMSHDILNIPSWCPDFGLHLQAYPVDYTRFAVTADMRPEINFEGGRLLKVNAAIFDEIVQTKELNRETLINEFKLWGHVASRIKSKYPTGEGRIAALIRTIIMDAGRVTDESRKQDFPCAGTETQILSNILAILQEYPKDAEIVYKSLPELKKMAAFASSDHDEDFDEEISRLVDHRCLFRTQKGYLGLGLMDSRIGDKVCLLAGAHVPHILRHVDHEEIMNRYQFVGDAYVHGIMFGEAVRGRKLDFQPITIE